MLPSLFPGGSPQTPGLDSLGADSDCILRRAQVGPGVWEKSPGEQGEVQAFRPFQFCSEVGVRAMLARASTSRSARAFPSLGRGLAPGRVLQEAQGSYTKVRPTSDEARMAPLGSI